MAEYVEREALENVICEERDKICRDEKERYLNGKRDALNEVHSLMLEIPAADVAPVRNGRCGMNEWISVKDGLPENNVRVLACGKDRCIHDVVWRWSECDWFDKVTGAAYMEGFVTHWMPLPEPPKGEA